MKCNDFDICSRNSDANCFRERHPFSIRLVRKKPSICNTCVYNKQKMESKKHQRFYMISTKTETLFVKAESDLIFSVKEGKEMFLQKYPKAKIKHIPLAKAQFLNLLTPPQAAKEA